MTDVDKPATGDAAINDEALDTVVGGIYHQKDDGFKSHGYPAGSLAGFPADVDPNVHFGVTESAGFHGQPQPAQQHHIQPPKADPTFQEASLSFHPATVVLPKRMNENEVSKFDANSPQCGW
jgi:hypothetical protein